ncbi:MAG: LuxR C-terminal-related transcriptional regulator [Adhaeribacter sp.]
MINIGIVEQDLNRRHELKNFINSQRELVCSFSAPTVRELLSQITACHLVMVFLLSADGQGGTSAALLVKDLKQQHPESDVIVLSGQDDTASVLAALRAGALGYMAPNTPLLKIKETILGVSVGGAYMSPAVARKITDYFREEKQQDFELTVREKEIVACLTEGLSYKMIASRLLLSLDTVRFHLRNIYKKLHVNSKAEVIAKVLKKEYSLS